MKVFWVFYIITYFCGKCVNGYENMGATEAAPSNNRKEKIRMLTSLLFLFVC